MIAALYVQKDGIYYGLPDVDPWDEERDARNYEGQWPVVAHPPCARWCQLASVNEARWGAKIGEDGGCFEAALRAVRRFGGVLEHPAYSLAWSHYMLPVPTRGLWVRSLWDEGWVTEVSQSAYGHKARKRTWLYLVGEPHELDWSDSPGEMMIGNGINSGEGTWAPKMAKREASATPIAFRDELILMAEGAREHNLSGRVS